MARRKTTPFSNSVARIATRPEQAEQLLQAGLGSALAIARASVETLMKLTPGLAGDEARRLHQRASALAVLAARHYREQRLTATEKTLQPWRSGLRTLVDGPNFENLFSPSWDENCPPGSIEATTSPAAYLTALFQWATTVIEPLANTEEDEPIFLADRRPDLAALVLDNHSLERIEPTIGIVNEILESAARKHLDDHNQKTLAVDDALLGARYPFALPFERYMSQINAILQRKNHGLGDLVRQLDPEFPYFCRGGLHSLRSDDALQMDTALGPEQRALLLEAAYFPRGARRVSARSVQTRTNPRSLLREPLHALQAGFFKRHYGVDKAEDLLPLAAFCLRTGLDQDGIESLLSIQRYAPVASPNVPGLAAPTPAQFGSVYINAGLDPAIGVGTAGSEHTLSDWSNDHFDRMQRMTRLAGWLDLSFGETDLLLDAALQAEYGSAGRGREITENTLRALGLFRRLRRDFKVSAEDFAALLQGVALYARGSEIAQFDRVFNDPTLFSEALVLDDSAFTIIPGNDAEYRKVNHLCAALGIDFEAYLYLARYIAQAWGEEALRSDRETDSLRWSHAVVSAFYRLARLPVWLGLNCIEAVGLLQLIGERGHQYVSRLVRTSLAIHQHSDLSDTLSVVQSLVDTVQWYREHELSVAWLYQHLMPLAPVAAASDRELDLLRQINGRMLPTILSEAVFRDAGLPMTSGSVDLPVPIEWLKALDTFVSGDGLILERSDSGTGEEYEAALRGRLELIVSDFELDEGPHVVMRAFQLVMDARSAQHSLVWESLASTFGGSAELSQEVLAWAGGNGFQLLGEVLRLFGGATDPLPIPIGDEVLALFARLGHRMGIVAQLSLSPLAVRSWCQHPEWFERQDGTGSDEVTFARVHLLTQYRHLLESTHQAEQSVLDYLKLVNSLPPDLTEQDLQLIREDAAGKIALFTGFGIREILEIAREITEHGILGTVRELDHLVRVRQACEHLQLGSGAALALSRLRSNSPGEEYRAAAESALSSLTEQLGWQVPPAHGELGQSEASWLVADTQLLVAKAGGKARCLLTVKNFLGQALPGITVAWETSLSTLGAPSSLTTDENGQVEIELFAGEEMGIAQVAAHFGLDRQILAPLIRIDCDDTSLYFQNMVREPDEALAGNLELIEFRLKVQDTLGNPGRDRVVEWSTDLGTFERPQTRADADGLAIAHLRSLSSGMATVTADLPLNGEQESFDPVTFLEQAYFQYVRFGGPVAASQIATATCLVVSLDGSPQGGVTVVWSADFGGFVADPATSITDAQGIASIEYLSEQPGEVTLTVNATHDDKSLLPLSSLRTRVHDLPRLVEMEPAEQYFVIYQARPATFRVRLEPAAAGYPVTWWADGKLLATTQTSADGSAAFQHYFNLSQLGDQTITVRSLRDGDHFDFKVKVVTPHSELKPDKGPDSPGMVPINPAEGKFAVEPGLLSRLSIRALRSDGSGDDECRLTFTLVSGADPDALGVVFDPPFGETVNCGPDGVALLNIDCTQAAFLPNSDPHSNEFTVQVMSNLGVSLELKLRLRYLLDLAKSELHFFRGTNDYFDQAGFSGRLRRRNGDAPLLLRDGARTLRLTLDGVPDAVETQILAYEQEGTWLHAPVFTGKTGEVGTRCTFQAAGDLGKRIQFAGSSVYEAKKVIGDGVLVAAATDDPGLIVDGTLYIVDQGGTYDLSLVLSDGEGPIAGAVLLPPSIKVEGVEFRCSGPTDASGRTHIEVDTAGASLGATHAIAAMVGNVVRNVRVRVVEMVQTAVDMALNDARQLDATVTFTRREGRPFADVGSWSGYIRIVDGVIAPFAVGHHPQRVTLTREGLATPVPAVLQVGLSLPTSLRRLLIGDTEFPITEDMAEKGDES